MSQAGIQANLTPVNLSEFDCQLLSYAFSHDLQAPLRAILGFSERLYEQEQSPPHQAIFHSAQQLQAALSGLHEYLSLCRLPPRRDEVDLAELLPEGVELETELPKIPGERTCLGVILRELVGNALLYHPPDRPPRVSVGFQGNALWVRDRGIGIAPEHHQLIFQPFQRLHPNAHFPGCGLGLTLARRAAQAMGAELQVESRPGQGSTFTLRLEGST